MDTCRFLCKGVVEVNSNYLPDVKDPEIFRNYILGPSPKVSDWWSVKMYDTAVVEGRCQGGDDMTARTWQAGNATIIIPRRRSLLSSRNVKALRNIRVTMEWITAEVLRLHSEEDLQVFKARNIVFKRYG
ncbi:hypothetical protein EYR41_006390 [Orbilia oligospora]|uniref:Uncharacterized protein n=1 Tax=Orbilia oligospora TaxID=2813651 RepID=A0A8H2HSF4_ORBOL|nr:hypothetical protein EYR41_006390 [Orbilia oligospora]